ncbi:MAG: phosphohistidine phosphatase [Chloroflexota bacterium]
MMKTLLLLRHAKAEPEAAGGDHERALTPRGRQDAAATGRILAELRLPIDLIVSSDARRARETAEIVANVTGWPDALTLEPRIYGASVGALLDVIHTLPESSACALLVGHNPGFADLAAVLCNATPASLHLPTASIAHLEIDHGSWRDVQPGSAHLRAMLRGRKSADS